MARKKLIILSVIVIGIIAVLLMLATKKENNAISTKSSPAPFPQTNTTDLSIVPSPPNKFIWTKLPQSEVGDLYNRVSITKEPDVFLQETELPGEVWFTNLKQVSSDDFDPEKDLYAYYRVKLDASKWSSKIKGSGYELSIRDAKYWVFVSNITSLADIVEQVE